MRKELELTEKIDRYLQGQMGPEEKAAFEKEMQSDPALREMAEVQKLTMKGMKKTWLKETITNASKKYFMKQLLKKGAVAVAVAGVALAVLLWYNMKAENNREHPAPEILPELNENGEKIWSDADKYLDAQYFFVDPEKDTVVETRGGIVLAIPSDCFKDQNGNPVKGPVKLTFKEALTPEEIMKAGLETKSNGELLETGGMFYLNAMKDGENLVIDPSKPIYTEIPTNEIKSGMMLFKGERTNDGKINWVNPKPLGKKLIPVDIFSLDFYPPQYLDSLAGMGRDSKNKKYTDSLYYSFANLFDLTPPAPQEKNLVALDSPGYIFGDTAGWYYSENTFNWICGINPAKIKAIWSDKFQKTLIATKEFEDRVKYIHSMSIYHVHDNSLRGWGEKVLDLYISNLDKRLSSIDSLANLWQFAARNDGGIDLSEKHIAELKEYYDRKSRIYTETASLLRKKYMDELNAKRNSYSKMKYEQAAEDWKRNSENFQKELDLNMRNAYKQLGMPYPENPGNNFWNPVSRPRYGTNISTTGWNNIDKYVLESTLNRTTLNYTAPDGKKAVIKYEEWSVDIANAEGMDRIYVYLLPENLYSFMRVNEEDGTYSEKLNELISYQAVVMGFRDDKVFYADIPNVKPGTDKVELKEKSWSDIEKKLGKRAKDQTLYDLVRESEIIKKEIVYLSAEKKHASNEEFRERVKRVIFPCYSFPSDTIAK